MVLITCNFNFMSRLANGLGVELGEGRQEQTAAWLSPEAAAQGVADDGEGSLGGRGPTATSAFARWSTERAP